MNYPRLWGIALPTIVVGQLALKQSRHDGAAIPQFPAIFSPGR
jgi:hypothetical protein